MSLKKKLVPIKVIERFTLLGMALIIFGCDKQPSPPLSPSEALESFVLAEDDIQIELVAAEPLVQDPVVITFDENGRLWVVEMLGFMSDIDGTGENDPVGRISVLTDEDQDGQMDKSHVFLDSLVLPRAIAIVKGGILVAENIPLWYVQDTDGDLRADTKILVDSTYGGRGMPEHAANGLWRGMDNWLYNAKSRFKYRLIDGTWQKEATEFRGQWGIGHDNAGRLFYNYNWSQLHADLVPPNLLQRNKNHSASSGIDHGLTLERKIFPIRSNRAVNRGYVPGTLDDHGKLLEFASACGPLVYRGDALAGHYLGNAFVCEPTANLIKRNSIIEEGFMLSAKGVYANKEFLASTDERFRPISLSPGPDGSLYIVDMYKGIIQHGPYMTPYLREVTLERKLDKPIHMGRIWKISPKKKTNRPIPDLAQADTKTLIGLLGHPNGWVRDNAQRLLVEKGEPIAMELENVLSENNPLAQLHALWTMEGLGILSAEKLLPFLKSKDPFVVQTLLRLIVRPNADQISVQKELTAFIQENYDTAHPIVQMQMVFACDAVDSTIGFNIFRKFLNSFGQLPVARDVVMSSLQNREAAMLESLLKLPEWTDYDQNHEIFIEMLATAISNKGNEKEILQVLRHIGTNQQWISDALSNGMISSKGSNEAGEIILSQQPSIATQEGIPDVLASKIHWPGKPRAIVASNLSEHEVDSDVFAMGRQKYLNLCANCHGTQGEGMPRFAPPLKNSEWVLGEDYRLIMVLLHGMEGPITVNGKKYDTPDILPIMPSFSTLQNEEIAAITTYIRNAWGHSQPPVTSGSVGHIRFRTQGQITPWKATALDTVVFDKDL